MLTLDQIVSSYLSQHERPQSEFRRIYDIALRVYKFCDLHSTALPETVDLDVLANKTAVLPSNCITGGVIEVGYQDDEGIIVPLVENRHMTFLNSTSATRATGIPASDETTVELYPSGSRIQLGNSYKVDYENSVIVLDYDFPEDTLVIKYLKAFSEQSEEYVVNPFFEETIISGIQWHNSKRISATKADRDQNRRDFYNDLSISMKAINKFSPRELYESYRREQSLGKNRI